MISLVFIDWTLVNLLSIFGLALGLSCSLYLFYEWLKHDRKQAHFLLWSVGLLFFYIFQIPFIRVNLGNSIILLDWMSFFTITVSLVFLGWVLVYWGIVSIKSYLKEREPTVFPLLLLFWVIASFIFYYFRFSLVEYGKTLSIIGFLIFFIPIHAFILFSLLNWLRVEYLQKPIRVKIGILVIIVAVIISIARYLIVLSSLMQLPRIFWFLSAMSFDFISILRSVVIILMTIGFFLVHRHYVVKPTA